MSDAAQPPTVFVLVRTGVDAGPLRQALALAHATVAELTLDAPDGSGAGPLALAPLAAALPAARFVLLADGKAGLAAGELDGLEEQRLIRVDRDTLLSDPRGELQRVCAFLGVRYDQALLSPIEAAARAERDASIADGSSPFASSSTGSFGELIAKSSSSLLISTYQTHRLIVVRAQEGELNTHFRGFQKPMGIAVTPGRIAIGTRTEVWDLWDVPAAAPKLDPPGTHDACYVPRNRHVTGDIAVHDLAFAGGELWVTATSFSCLATLDGAHSFVPRWTPPWITRLAPEDRCHLNGLAVIDDRVAFTTALGRGDQAGSWREHKASGGVLIDVVSGEVAVGGLSMPHSPRWHAGRLWLLESGRGALVVCDLERGQVETVAEMPGFTRGLAFLGRYALIGLSQIRESSTFGDLPITHRLQERQSGVWVVDLLSGTLAGFLRFEDLVQEVFEVAVLPGRVWPEITEPDSQTTATTYVLPD